MSVNASHGVIRECAYCGVTIRGNVYFAHIERCRIEPTPIPPRHYFCELCGEPASKDDILCWFHARLAGHVEVWV